MAFAKPAVPNPERFGVLAATDPNPMPSPQTRPTPRLTIVIVNYNAWDEVTRLCATFAAAPELQDGHCEVVVVDNASTDPPPARFLRPVARSPQPAARYEAHATDRVCLIRRRDNGGFAAGVNTGWAAARSPWLLVLNPDVVAGPELLHKVLERIDYFEALPGGAPGIVGFGLRNTDGTRQPSVGVFPSLVRSVWGQLIPRSRRKYQAGWRTRSGPVAWVTGACLLLNTRLLAEVGGMDEDFFLYYEEVALCRLARRRGWRVEYDPSIEVVHLRPLQNRPITPTLRVITRHSKLLYFRKHLPRWQFVSLSWIVRAEAELRGWWCRLRDREEERRAWRAIARLAPAMRRGVEVRGPAVRALAESVTRPERGPVAARTKHGRRRIRMVEE
jgi:N-acetylglucosaminyl-diphospho-decaprenol L-rhamnosyltransferase